VTLCQGTDVHAFVQTQRMMDGKRPALAPLAGTVMVHLQSATFGVNQNVDTFANSGAALMEIGVVPPGSYDATATLWGGTTVNPDGTSSSYPASAMSMKLTITDSPCGGTAPLSTSTKTKSGCGVGDANHEHAPDPGKTCPTK
jgi:hypothetical protein